MRPQLTDDEAMSVRANVVQAAAVLAQEMSKTALPQSRRLYESVEDILWTCVVDSHPQVADMASELLAPSLITWASKLGSLWSRFLPTLLRQVHDALFESEWQDLPFAARLTAEASSSKVVEGRAGAVSEGAEEQEGGRDKWTQEALQQLAGAAPGGRVEGGHGGAVTATVANAKLRSFTASNMKPALALLQVIRSVASLLVRAMTTEGWRLEDKVGRRHEAMLVTFDSKVSDDDLLRQLKAGSHTPHTGRHDLDLVLSSSGRVVALDLDEESLLSAEATEALNLTWLPVQWIVRRLLSFLVFAADLVNRRNAHATRTLAESIHETLAIVLASMGPVGPAQLVGPFTHSYIPIYAHLHTRTYLYTPICT